ncbi:uncharacterized protein LOC143446115 isoform X2 [Clavelina lepadiformis]|uniref:uncharacterized protein LOC143446115 isoform X2 n=1 Tax=Clavelina lepadiformis TaxID=159417 RepID=UPI00404100EF
MQKYLELSLSVILQTAVMIQGQSISPVTTPHPVQATDSTVVITATAFPPSSVISSGGNWIVDWRYNGTRVAQAGYVAYPVVVSVVESSIYSSRMNISAIAMSASSFTTQLTIAQLKANEDGDLVELGGPGVGAQSIVLNIRDCNSSLPYDVIVDTTSRIFNSPGKFACSNGGELFYSNGIILTSSDTTCLASAEWSGQDNLQCWTAPNVTLASSSIEGNKLIVIEGANLSLTCNYDDVIPEGSTSRLYIGGKSYNRTQGEPFILSSLQRNDNNKVVSCQAVTPYTDVYPGSGRSLEYTLDVLYAPDTVTSKVELSQYTIVAEEGYLLRSDENLTMQCIYSEANPPANCNFTFHMTQSNTVSSVSGCSISYDLDQSSLVSCTARNEVGSRSSNNETITVVPAQRIPEFNVTVSNITSTGGYMMSYLGEDVNFSCTISYSDELNTTYLLYQSNDVINTGPSVTLSAKPSDTGNYSCTTMDSFGTYSSSIYLDVLYEYEQSVACRPYFAWSNLS